MISPLFPGTFSLPGPLAYIMELCKDCQALPLAWVWGPQGQTPGHTWARWAERGKPGRVCPRQEASRFSVS